MSFRRSIIAKSKLFYEQSQRFAPSFLHISSSDREESPAKSICRNSENRSHFLITRNSASNSLLSGNVSRLMRCGIPAGYGLIFHRNMSKVAPDIEVIHDAQDFNGVIGVVVDKAVEAAPVVSEVAIAAADSFAPVAACHYLIDYVHCYTGFEWWASIAAATVMIRFLELPLLIHTLKFLYKNHTIVLPQLSRAQNTRLDMDPHEGNEIIRKILKKFGIIPFTGNIMLTLTKLFFFFAILNLVEEVPSFMTGGTLWFTDLTTPDRMCLPFLFALTVGIRVKLDPRYHAKGMKPSTKLSKLYTAMALFGTIAAGLPTAVYCYWIPSNLFSIAYGIAMKDSRVKKLLGISSKPRSTHK